MKLDYPGPQAGGVYVRLHGPGGPYQGSYGEEALAGWAARIRAWRAAGMSVYCYFDNDAEGHAPGDALRLSRRFADGQISSSA